jgi:hypothetical protein
LRYFNETGRRIPTKGMRTFGQTPSYYYKISQPEINFASIFERQQKFNRISNKLTVDEFSNKAESLLDIIKKNDNYSNLLKGVHVPFVLEYSSGEDDLGASLERTHLPNLKSAFNDRYPDSHFKAILQSNSELPGHVSLDPDSRYDELIDTGQRGSVVGWYFPQALQEFDIKSQRSQMKELPILDGAKICLSGGVDICSALIGTPELLISEDDYAPILCMSAYVHADPRLVLLLKSYGPHMEFWCMTQMLTKDTTQVSEQWAGGLTVFR